MPLTREQDRERMRRRRAAMTEAERDEERRKARERMRRLAERYPDRERNRNRKRTYRPRKKVPKAPKVHKAIVVKREVPADVRAAYGKAHPNSIIKRKYPTWAALRRAWS